VTDNITIKQEPTGATYARSALTAGNTIATPVIAGGILGYVFRVIDTIWPTFVPPTEVECMYMGLAVAGVLGWWASFSVRGTKVTNGD
jgi:hypothetical protein